MQRLLDIKRTQLQLVVDRGYQVPIEESNISLMTIEEFAAYVSNIAAANKIAPRAALSRYYEDKDASGVVRRTMLVFFGGKTEAQQKQVSADVVRRFIQAVQSYNVTEAVLIVDAPLSSTANNELNALTLVRWQIFNDSDLTYNPTRHVDTPRHELLEPGAARELLREMKVDVSKLLIIKANDPVIRYYGWPVGGIVRVHRNDRSVSILAPKSVNYRIITD